MNSNFNHTYTQLLIVFVLAYELKDRPWWHLFVAIIISAVLAAVASIIIKHMGAQNDGLS